MEDRHWFIFQDGIVHGPFNQLDLELRLGQFTEPLIWGRGMQEWHDQHKWKRTLAELEKAASQGLKQGERSWKLRINGKELPPMSYDLMLDQLKSKSNLNDIFVWTEGYSEWRPIFQIHKVLDDLGVSRRAHPRVPIMGTVTLEGASGTMTSRVLSISEGGLGINEAHNVKIGEKFKVILKSPNLYTPIHATGEIVYVGSDSYAGMKFIGLHSESKSAIIEYVKKFSEAKKTT